MERKPKFVPYVDAGGAHRWRLVDTNGRIIADGAEGYVDAGQRRPGDRERPPGRRRRRVDGEE
jgi:hypothetical protein